MEKLKTGLQSLAMAIVDAYMAIVPRPPPARPILENCKLVSHRGEHDNIRVMENTLPAFEAAREAGVWGIECDIRWTRDRVPVICHDPDGKRVFQSSAVIAELSLKELRAVLPELPTLQQVVDDFGGNTHLMLEIKDEYFPDKKEQQLALREHLSALTPVKDFHVLALDPGLFELVAFLPEQACLPVAETNTRDLSQVCLEQRFGGLAGHYLLLSETLKNRHNKVGQRVGTGFPASVNCLWRELNRGVEWVFTNHAVMLQKTVNRYLEDKARGSG